MDKAKCDQFRRWQFMILALHFLNADDIGINIFDVSHPQAQAVDVPCRNFHLSSIDNLLEIPSPIA
jgi:hypothetical protein